MVYEAVQQMRVRCSLTYTKAIGILGGLEKVCSFCRRFLVILRNCLTGGVGVHGDGKTPPGWWPITLIGADDDRSQKMPGISTQFLVSGTD
jgi:hypothetical protein